MADPKIKYDIEADVKGDASVEALEQRLRALGQTLDGELKTQANAAADALKNLGAKQEALATFRQLSNESKAMAVEIAQANGEVTRLARALPQAAAASSQFAAAETAARSAVASTRADLDQQRQALVALRQEFTGASRRTDDYRESSAQLKITVASLRETLKEKQAALQAATGQVATAAAAEKKLSVEYSAAADSANKMRGAVLENSRALDATRASLAAAGISTNNLAQSERNLEAAVGQVRTTVQGMAPAFAQAAAASSGSVQRQISDQQTLKQGVRSVGDELRRIQSIAMLAVGGGFLGGIAKDALATADTFKNLEARIKLVTGEGALLASSFKGVSEIALRTNSDLEQTATLFTRITEAGKSAGLGAKEAVTQSLALTETINQTIQLSGGSADSSKAAITQLIQGLQSGVLRGEEFNSVMEQSPRLAKALADGLDVTTGELRKMANAGTLTTDVVIRSLRSQADAIKTEFGSLPATVGRSIENLRTSWTLFVGDLDKGAGISKTVAGAIDSLANNLNGVLTVAGHAAVAWGGYTLSQKLAAAGARQSALAVEQSALAATGQAAASGRAAVATSAHGKAAVVAAGQVSTYTAANINATVAANANAAGATGGAGNYRALGGAVLGAASKLAIWGTVAYEGYGILKSTGVALGEGIAKWQGYKNAEEVMAEQEKKLAEATKATADGQYKQAEAMRIAKDESFGLSKEAGVLATKFDALVKGGDSAAEAIGKIGKDFDLSTLPGIQNAAGVLDKLLADGKLTAAQFQGAWAAALNGKDLAVFETTARAAFAGTKREAELLAQLLDAGLRESVKRAGLDFENLKGGISKTAQSAVNDTQAIINGLDRLSAQGVDTGRVLTASLGKGINTADTQQALELVKQQIEAVRSKLGETVTNGLLDQAKQKSLELGDALEKATPGINSVREAMKELGITSDQTFKDTAEKSKTAYEAMRTSGLASARELSEGFKKAAADAIAANNGIAPSWVQAQAAAKGYEVAINAAGKATLKAMGDGTDAINKTGEALSRATDKANELAKALINAKYSRPGEGAKPPKPGDSKDDYDPGYGSPYSRPGESPVNGDGLTKAEYDRKQNLKGQNAVDNKLMFKLRDKGDKLTAADIPELEAVLAAERKNDKMINNRMGGRAGLYSLDGLRDDSNWRQIKAGWQSFIDGEKNKAPVDGAQPKSAQTSGSGNAAPQQSRTVNVDLRTDHGIETVPTTENGAQALLRALKNAKSTSSR